jgi:O-methyltransferase involved in polyketide biosynthesis
VLADGNRSAIAFSLADGGRRVHDLEGVPATLFIALAGKALGSIEAPELGFADLRAQRILEKLEIDPRRFGLTANEVRAIVLRSQWFAQTIRGFFERNPQGLCINVGCGLDASFEQVMEAGGERFRWIDLDLPEVIAIRRQFFVETAQRRMVAGDVSNSSTFAVLPWDRAQPALIVAEGLLYFLKPAQIKTFFQLQAEAADARRSVIEIAFDYASPLGAWIVSRRPAHRQLGTACSWTIRRARELRQIDQRLEVVEDSNVFLGAMSPSARKLNAIYRLVSGAELGGCARLRRTPSPEVAA